MEIPGILEVRKQVSRLFPFNDACQWFIDRADIIFLVYDPSKLDVGPETEAILDQLKGREHQVNKINAKNSHFSTYSLFLYVIDEDYIEQSRPSEAGRTDAGAGRPNMEHIAVNVVPPAARHVHHVAVEPSVRDVGPDTSVAGPGARFPA